MRKSKQNPATCDCCEGVDVLTPLATYNRPGLDAIAYRVGTHGSFLETMKARLSSSEFPKLAELTTRESRDASIALLDAWATVGDVLTFYQERIANEGYLRTAIERRSILELARLVGYRLKPGLSASVYLAYTLEPTQQTTVIEIGNKAQSIPGPNELPQIFETAEKLIAYSGLNLMKPRLNQPQLIKQSQVGELTIAVKGASLNLKVNDGVLLEFTVLQPSQVVQAFYRVGEVTTQAELDRTILKLNLVGQPPSFPGAPAVNFADARNRLRAIVQKYLAIDAFGLSATSKTVERVTERLERIQKSADELDINTSIVETTKMAMIRAQVKSLRVRLDDQYSLASARGWDNIAAWLAALIDDLGAFEKILAPVSQDGSGFDNKIPTIQTGLQSFVELFQPFKLPQSLQPSGEAHLARKISNIYAARSEFVGKMYGVINPQAEPFVSAVLTNAGSVLNPTPSPRKEGVIALSNSQALRLRAFVAGRSLPIVTRQAPSAVAVTTITVSPPNLAEYLHALDSAGFPADTGAALSVIALDAEYDQIKAGSQVVIRHPGQSGFVVSIHTVQQVNSSQLTLANVTVPSTVLTLNRPWLTAAETQGGAVLESNAIVRSTSVYAQSEALTLAETEIAADLGFEATDLNPIIELDGLYSNLEPGRWTIISGERVVIDTLTNQPINTGVIVSELVMVASVAHEAKVLVDGEPVEVKGEKLHTFIRPAQPPAFRYRRGTVKIFGNVVRATHGETRNEVLGSGDGSKGLQTFQLLQPPLTYLAAPNPSGNETTLAVRINDVLWSESDNLFALGRDIRKYITKTDDEGKTSVIFGDGEHGSRLPTGIENVRAVYRQGLGKGGNVKAEQIKLPLTKPLGVKGVINPLPASGGVDKETRDQARRNAPIAVLALDRLVSVQDYADFARTFAGIAKASARRLSDGDREVVHLTIAGAGNIPIDVTSDLYRNLLAALARFGDPLQPVQVESFERVLLVVSARVSVLPEYLWEKVKEKMRATLWEKLDFENRELGQDVTLSEVLSLMQSVPGVNYVDFDVLDSVSEEKLKDPNFGSKLKLRGRVNANFARMNQAGDDILPAQLVFLSRDAVDTLILEEVTV